MTEENPRNSPTKVRTSLLITFTTEITRILGHSHSRPPTLLQAREVYRYGQNTFGLQWTLGEVVETILVACP